MNPGALAETPPPTALGFDEGQLTVALEIALPTMGDTVFPVAVTTTVFDKDEPWNPCVP